MVFFLISFFFSFLPLTEEQNAPDKLNQKDHEIYSFISSNQKSKSTDNSIPKTPISSNKASEPIYFDRGRIYDSKIINYHSDLTTKKDKTKDSQSELSEEPNTAFQDYSNGIFEGLQDSIYINDDNIYSEITNSQFIDYQLSEDQDQYLFIIQKGFTFDHVKFILNKTDTSKYGAIKIECKSEVTIQNCEFIHCNGQNAIYFAPTPSSLMKENDENQAIKSIENCTFIECGDETTNGFAVLLSDSNELVFIGCTFDFSTGGIKIEETVASALIEECYFIDCTKKIDGSISAVVVINNSNCVFTNNTVSFTSNEYSNSLAGLWILHHGDIVVTNNYFFRIRGESLKGAIYITDKSGDGTDNDERVVIFNYNVIEDCGNIKNGNFVIEKIFDFNFDHNVIKNCVINDYSCSIGLMNSKKYSHEFQLENLSLINCESNSRIGGGFGLWLVFASSTYEGNLIKQGVFTLRNCLFLNNYAGPTIEGGRPFGGCGGGFHWGNATSVRASITIEGCRFENNRAHYLGGAISLQSMPENRIINTIFINNSAPSGGGAIHLSTKNYNNNPNINYGIMEKCTIINCTFISNKDSSNCGHAIYFCSDDPDTNTKLEIDSCSFTNNGLNDDQQNEITSSIVSDSPYFTFINSIITFSSTNHSISGIKLEFNTKEASIQSSEFINISGSSSIDIKTNKSEQINILDSIFLRSTSSNSAINYDPLLETDYLNIYNCIFNNCSGGCLFIDSQSESVETINIEKVHFLNCSSDAEHKFSVIGSGTNIGSIRLNVKDCLFNYPRSNTRYSYVISLVSDKRFPQIISNLMFANNIFEPNELNSGLSLNFEMNKCNVIVENCTFGKSIVHDLDPWANTIRAIYLQKITILKCTFHECGNNNGETDNGNVIGIGLFSDQERSEEGTDILVQDCIFNHTSSAISSYSENVDFIGNILYKVGKSAFRLSPTKSKGGIRFSDNIITDSYKGAIIHCWNYELRYSPYITNNTFERISTRPDRMEENQYAFIFNFGNNLYFSFSNNTFRNFTTFHGGFGALFKNREQEMFQIMFVTCYFEGCKQTSLNGYKGDGGAIRLSNDYNEGNVQLTFSLCHFINNEADGSGGALYLTSNENVRMSTCTFESNKAKKGSGGAIYASSLDRLLVFNCKFDNNYASKEGHAIYSTSEMKKLLVQVCNYSNNINLENDNIQLQYMIVLENGGIDIFDVRFRCNSENRISYPILFKSMNVIENIKFTNVVSEYSPLLYIFDEMNDYEFNNLVFIDCECKEYVIDLFNSKTNINGCNISFSQKSTNACGGIRFNSGSFNLENCTFSYTKSLTGTICYNNCIQADENSFIIIQNCTLSNCFNQCININTLSGSQEMVTITENTFINCINDDECRVNGIFFAPSCDSISLSIEKNTFEHCSKNNIRSVLISFEIESEGSSFIKSDIEFYHNIINYELTESVGHIAFQVSQLNRRVLIDNCSFTNCFKDNGYPWANAICVNKVTELIVTKCYFYHCGYNIFHSTSLGGYVIAIIGDFPTNSIISNCTFNESSSAVSSYSESTSFIGNKLINCGRNAFRITHENGDKGFEIIENHFFNCTDGCIIHTWLYNSGYINYQPVILRNIFESVHISDYDVFNYERSYAFVFNLDQMNSILFENNIFRDFDTAFGGFSGRFISNSPINLTFSNCLFDHNSQKVNGGAFCSTQNLNCYLNFTRCNFSNNMAEYNGSAIYIETDYDVIISDCIFFENGVTSTQVNKFGGSIYVSKVGGIFSVTGCEFVENYAKEGHAIYIESNVIIEIVIKNCLFINKNAFEGSEIYSASKNARVVIQENTKFESSSNCYMIILPNSELVITDVEFDCFYPILFYDVDSIQDIEFRNIKSYKSSLLILQNSTYQINHILFYNITSNSSIIESNVQLLIFNSSFELISNYGIFIEQPGDHVIENTNFSRVEEKSILMDIRISTLLNNIFTISGCLFDSCGNKTDRIVLLRIPYVVHFVNNIVNNICNTKYGIVIYFNKVDEITIESCTFINNNMITKHPSMYSGGCGLWISRTDNNLIIWYKLKINYINCKWINNSANKNYGGGALQVGFSTLINIELLFSKCEFVKNKALKGGALSIQTVQPLTISDCLFMNNEAYSQDGLGGALFIEPDFKGRFEDYQMEICEIVNCTFIGNSAMSKNGHTICMEGGVDTLLCIYSNNTFKDNNNENGGGSLILYRGQNIHLEFPQFSDIKKSRFIQFGESSDVDIKDAHFIDCFEKEGDGNAVKIESNASSVCLTNCSFTNCGNSGYAIAVLGAKITFANCIFKFDDSSKACCSLKIETNLMTNIDGCSFINNINKNQNDKKFAALFYYPKNQTESVTIKNCLFDRCDGLGTNFKAFVIRSKFDITFSNNTVQNVGKEEEKPTGGFVGEIMTSVSVFEIDHCNFMSIYSSSQFGGGSGLLILSEKVVFNKCKFINNKAIQMTNSDLEQRPQPDGIEGIYYNGDGGGLQFGYSESTSSTDLEFIACTFKNNQAKRHGGAIAIQTLKTVNIINSTFESNIADSLESSSSSLLSYENHFGKKQEGRGGAIYINPTFSYHKGNEIYPNDDDHMKKININNCIFKSNRAFDGFAIYIEGDEPENNFEISIVNNEFTNNNQINGDEDVNKSFRATIASEVNLSYEEILTKNTFNPTTKITHVDHYGNLIQMFLTPSIDPDISMTSDESSLEPTTSDPISESTSFTETDDIGPSSISSFESSYHESIVFGSSNIDDDLSGSSEIFPSSSQSDEDLQLTLDFSSSKINGGQFIGADNKKKGMSIGAIIGIVCGIVVVAIVLTSVLVFIFVKRKRNPLNNSFHADEISNKNSTKSISERTIERDEEEVDLNFWL